MRGFGILLIVLGLAALVVGERGITRNREVARIGTFKATVQERQTYPAARWGGIAALVVGAGVLGMGLRRRHA